MVLFGDADNGDPLGDIPTDRVKIICNKGDWICEYDWKLPNDPHMEYPKYAREAAVWVANLIRHIKIP